MPFHEGAIRIFDATAVIATLQNLEPERCQIVDLGVAGKGSGSVRRLQNRFRSGFSGTVPFVVRMEIRCRPPAFGEDNPIFVMIRRCNPSTESPEPLRRPPSSSPSAWLYSVGRPILANTNIGEF
ncbi:MAG: hypothetical protein DMG30_23835 [Acidobacteria bacterium]|nr:MAG: hypothetical protein DMG30_23835 [Acidobacteriota bacterium]